MKKLVVLVLAFLFSSCAAQNTTNTMKTLLTPYKFQSHYINLKDGELSYIKEGSGKQVLIFLHGLSSNGDAWSNNISELKKNYTCIALDLPGYGRSYKEADEFSATYFAKVLDEFVTSLKIEKFVLVGHSMGGQASIKYTSLHPEKVEKLVLVAPAGIEEFSPIEALTLKNFTTQDFVKNTTDEQIEKNYAVNFYHMPESVKQLISDRKNIKNADDFSSHALAIEKSVKGMLDDKVIEDLQKIKTNTLVLFAENDMLIPNRFLHPKMTIFEIAEKAKQRLQNSQVILVSKAGHFLQFEKSDEVNKHISQFLNP